jgi:flagellar biosynthesis regulator FlaF
MSHVAYKQVQNVTEDPRAVEYRLLGQVTAELIAAAEDKKNSVRRNAALQWNRQVWAAFRLDLVGEDNKLAADLKAKLISLSFFVDRETVDILFDRTDFNNLIEINRNIMKGLQ